MLANKADALRHAEQLAGQGDINAAIAVYRGLIEADPLDLNSIHALADLYVRAGRIQEVLDELARLTDRLIAQGPAINAAPLLKRMLDLDPSNATLRMKLAAVYARAGHLEQAHQVFIEAGAAFARKGNLVAAIEAVKKALAIHPDSPQARAALAALEGQTTPPPTARQQAAARAQAERQVNRPAAPKVRNTSELAELGEMLSAAPTDFSAADVTDEFIVRQLFAAELLVGCGDIDKAVALLKRIIDYRPDAIDVRTKLKDIYLRSDMMREASQEFLEIARIYESRGDAVRAKDFSVRAQRLAQQLTEPAAGTGARRAADLQADQPRNSDVNQITISSDSRMPIVNLNPPATVQATQPANIKIEPSLATARYEPATPAARSASPSTGESLAQEASHRNGTSVLGLFDAAPAAVAETTPRRLRPQRQRVVFYAVAAAIVVTLLGGWFAGRRWYAAQLDQAYQTLARANSLPLPPPAANAEQFTLPRSEERMDVRAESPSPSSATVPTTQPSAPAHAEEAPRDEPYKEPPPAPATNSETAAINRNASPTSSKPVVPPVVTVTPPVDTNPDSTPQKSPVSPPRNVGTAEPPPPPAETRKAAVIVKGESLHRVQPDYPSSARAARQSGTVAVEVSINERGDVVAAQVLSGPPLLRAAATAAARRWKFKPATRDGQPISSVSTITFNFKM
ncbi:MAG: periplasmic protein TonB [Blastocatellia bacterium]